MIFTVISVVIVVVVVGIVSHLAKMLERIVYASFEKMNDLEVGNIEEILFEGIETREKQNSDMLSRQRELSVKEQENKSTESRRIIEHDLELIDNVLSTLNDDLEKEEQEMRISIIDNDIESIDNILSTIHADLEKEDQEIRLFIIDNDLQSLDNILSKIQEDLETEEIDQNQHMEVEPKTALKNNKVENDKSGTCEAVCKHHYELYSIIVPVCNKNRNRIIEAVDTILDKSPDDQIVDLSLNLSFKVDNYNGWTLPTDVKNILGLGYRVMSGKEYPLFRRIKTLLEIYSVMNLLHSLSLMCKEFCPSVTKEMKQLTCAIYFHSKFIEMICMEAKNAKVSIDRRLLQKKSYGKISVLPDDYFNGDSLTVALESYSITHCLYFLPVHDIELTLVGEMGIHFELNIKLDKIVMIVTIIFINYILLEIQI